MSFDLSLPFLCPIESLPLDESLSEIMGYPDATWWYERDGMFFREETFHFDSGRLRTGLELIANHLGKRLDEDDPILHAQLPDENRIAAAISTGCSACPGAHHSQPGPSPAEIPEPEVHSRATCNDRIPERIDGA